MDTGEAILAELREQTRLLRILTKQAQDQVAEQAPVTGTVTISNGDRQVFPPKDNSEKDERLDGINGAYRHYINPRAKESLTDKAKQKLRARLKRYTWEELVIAIHNFSEDEWNMKNNRHRGLAWFMNGDDRIEEFLNLDLKTVAEAEEKANACPKCGSDKWGFRGTVYQCESCNYTRQGIAPDSGRHSQGAKREVGLLGGGGAGEARRLGAGESQPQRRIAGATQEGYSQTRSGALPPAVSPTGRADGRGHYSESVH